MLKGLKREAPLIGGNRLAGDVEEDGVPAEGLSDIEWTLPNLKGHAVNRHH